MMDKNSLAYLFMMAYEDPDGVLRVAGNRPAYYPCEDNGLRRFIIYKPYLYGLLDSFGNTRVHLNLCRLDVDIGSGQVVRSYVSMTQMSEAKAREIFLTLSRPYCVFNPGR